MYDSKFRDVIKLKLYRVRRKLRGKSKEPVDEGVYNSPLAGSSKCKMDPTLES